MKEIILLKAGEIALKGLNRSTFEDRLVKNCKFRLRDIGSFKFTRAQSTMYAEPLSEDIDMDDAVETLQHIFGFSKLSKLVKALPRFEVDVRQGGQSNMKHFFVRDKERK